MSFSLVVFFVIVYLIYYNRNYILYQFNKHDNYKKGDRFESFVYNVIFPDSDYLCTHKTHSRSETSKRWIESTNAPDFAFNIRKSNFNFWVECKYRSSVDMNDGKVYWCTDDKQYFKYGEYNKELPLFLILGFSGHPSNPRNIYLIPYSQIKYQGLYLDAYKQYIIPRKKLTPSYFKLDRG